ncbi:unnamed protein product [Phytophthora fragariaefolia]|uniref:Unnamed protein product n=1 Tax=Phytophthora fragariaefolia TaxID=1490495 RepID=A0A9W6TM43_9STRA|nr:unnamed protein product [Phytophthora fragariaefolia]
MPQPLPALWETEQQTSQSAHFEIGTPEDTHSFLRPENLFSPRSSHKSPPSSRPSSPNTTSTATSPLHTRPPSGFVAPVVDLAPVSGVPNILRSTLGILDTALERTETYDTLRADHAALQQAYLASTHRVEALEAEL